MAYFSAVGKKISRSKKRTLSLDLVLDSVTGSNLRHVAQDPKSARLHQFRHTRYIRRHNALKYTLPLAV